MYENEATTHEAENEAEANNYEELEKPNKAMSFWCRWQFLDTEDGSQKATLVVLLVVINPLMVQKFLRLS